MKKKTLDIKKFFEINKKKILRDWFIYKKFLCLQLKI